MGSGGPQAGAGGPQGVVCRGHSPLRAVDPWIPGLALAGAAAQLPKCSWSLLGWDFLARNCLEQALA